MSAALQLLAALRERKIEPICHDGRLKLRGPAAQITSELVEKVRRHKADLLAHLRAEQERKMPDQALALLHRLRCYTLPLGRMPVAREMAQRLEPLKDASPKAIFRALQGFERDLVALGGAPDQELLEAAEAVEGTFPGTRMVEVRRKETLQ